MKLKEKVAVITGGGSGIGRATAKVLASEGAKILVFGRRIDKLEETASEIRSNGGEIITAVGSVTEETDIQKAVQVALHTFGKIDILVNNAGTGNFGPPLHQTTDEEWDRVIGTNLQGTYRMTRAIIPHFLQNKAGAIVNVSSTHGQIGLPGGTIYCASKGGMITMTKAIALEYARHGIRANCICPAAVDTDMLAPAMQDNKMRDWIVSSHPIGRIGTPEEIAKAILYLVSDDSTWVTGSVFTIDGGLTSQ